MASATSSTVPTSKTGNTNTDSDQYTLNSSDSGMMASKHAISNEFPGSTHEKIHGKEPDLDQLAWTDFEDGFADGSTLVEDDHERYVVSKDVESTAIDAIDKQSPTQVSLQEVVLSDGLTAPTPISATTPRIQARSIRKKTSLSTPSDFATPSSIESFAIDTTFVSPSSNDAPSKKRKRVSINQTATIFRIDRRDVTTVEELDVDKMGIRSGHFLKRGCTDAPEEMVKRRRTRSPHPVLRARYTPDQSPPAPPSHAKITNDESPFKLEGQEDASKRMRQHSPPVPPLSEFHEIKLPKHPSSPPLSADGSPPWLAPSALHSKGLPKDLRVIMVPNLKRPKPSKARGDPTKGPAPAPPIIQLHPITQLPSKVPTSEFDLVAPPNPDVDYIMGRNGAVIEFNKAEAALIPALKNRTSARQRGQGLKYRKSSGGIQKSDKKVTWKFKNLDSGSPTFECSSTPTPTKLMLKLKGLNSDSPTVIVECSSGTTSLPMAADGRPVAPIEVQNAIHTFEDVDRMYKQAEDFMERLGKMRQVANSNAIYALEAAHEAPWRPTKWLLLPSCPTTGLDRRGEQFQKQHDQF